MLKYSIIQQHSAFCLALRPAFALRATWYLFLFLGIGLGLLPCDATAAASKDPAQALVSEFNSLCNDKVRGGRRDLWLGLEEKFTALQTSGKGGQATTAAFYRARTRQELGSRSFLPADHREAVRLFGAFTDKYGKSSFVPESLLRRASILRERLGHKDEARKTFNRLIRSYPKSKEAAAAQKALAAMDSGEAAALEKKPAMSGGNAADGKGRTKGDTSSVMRQLGLTIQTIMLDPGHGGKDPGAMAGGMTERKFTLAMARRVGALLEKKGFTVLYTRSSDKYLSLQERPDLANSKKADLFISFHVNANNDAGVHGLETYYLDEARTRDAAVVAARENGIPVQKISDLQFILTDLMLSHKVKESHELAKTVHRGILSRLRTSGIAMHGNGVRSAPFYVLMGARMPSILVEFGYITNKADLAALQSERHLQRQAEGLVEGILQYRQKLSTLVPR